MAPDGPPRGTAIATKWFTVFSSNVNIFSSNLDDAIQNGWRDFEKIRGTRVLKATIIRCKIARVPVIRVA